jgi:hypothetical protein
MSQNQQCGNICKGRMFYPAGEGEFQVANLIGGFSLVQSEKKRFIMAPLERT